jgi:hypothetical protein
MFLIELIMFRYISYSTQVRLFGRVIMRQGRHTYQIIVSKYTSGVHYQQIQIPFFNFYCIPILSLYIRLDRCSLKVSINSKDFISDSVEQSLEDEIASMVNDIARQSGRLEVFDRFDVWELLMKY